MWCVTAVKAMALRNGMRTLEPSQKAEIMKDIEFIGQFELDSGHGVSIVRAIINEYSFAAEPLPREIEHRSIEDRRLDIGAPNIYIHICILGPKN